MNAPKPSPLLALAVAALLTLIWGTTWGAIRVSLEGIPPLAGAGLRFAIAGLLLVVLALARRVPLGGSRRVRWLWVTNGLTTFAGAYGITYWAEQYIPSSLAAVLFATFPLFVALIAHWALPAERLSWRSAIGVLVGFGGVVVIFSADLEPLGESSSRVLFASVVMLAAPLVSAMGQVIVKRWGYGVHPFALTAMPMLVSAAVLGALAAGFERHARFDFSWAPTAAVLYLAIFGSALTFTLYFWLLHHYSATRLSLIAYAIPLVAVVVGVLFLDETLTLRTLAGAALVLAGVLIANRAAAGTRVVPPAGRAAPPRPVVPASGPAPAAAASRASSYPRR